VASRTASVTPVSNQFESNGLTGEDASNMMVPGGSRRTRKTCPTPVLPSAAEEIDPTVTTMASLCNDTGTGRLSSKAAEIQSNHAAWRASNKEKRARMKLLMESKKYGRHHDDDEGANDPTGNTVADSRTRADATISGMGSASAGPTTSQEGIFRPEDGFDYSQDLATSRFNVQVRIGPNGETVIDENSLFVDRNDEESTQNYTHIEESDTTKFVNSGTYGKKFRGSRWSSEETELFYSVS
jgi:transcription factor TFIIIB component B''